MEDMGQNSQMDLKIDEEFRNLLPEPTREEYTNLEKSIVKRGVLSPLLVWHGTIIDGHTRYAICKAHRMKNIPTEEMRFQSREEAIAWILMNQLSRRNLTDFQKNEIALKYEQMIARQMRERQITSGREYGKGIGEDQLIHTYSDKTSKRKELAKIAGTSEGSIQRTKMILNKGTPEQIEKVRKGEVSLHRMAEEIKEKEIPEGMRKCPKCGRILPLDHFYDGGRQCRGCRNRNKKYTDAKGNVIETDEKYKNIPDQEIIDGLYRDVESDTTIEDVVHEFMTNFHEYMSSLEWILHIHSDIVSENQEQISIMFQNADREYHAMKGEYVNV